VQEYTSLCRVFAIPGQKWGPKAKLVKGAWLSRKGSEMIMYQHLSKLTFTVLASPTVDDASLVGNEIGSEAGEDGGLSDPA
jgi:hypothetical protein